MEGGRGRRQRGRTRPARALSRYRGAPARATSTASSRRSHRSRPTARTAVPVTALRPELSAGRREPARPMPERSTQELCESLDSFGGAPPRVRSIRTTDEHGPTQRVVREARPVSTGRCNGKGVYFTDPVRYIKRKV